MLREKDTSELRLTPEYRSLWRVYDATAKKAVAIQAKIASASLAPALGDSRGLDKLADLTRQLELARSEEEKALDACTDYLMAHALAETSVSGKRIRESGDEPYYFPKESVAQEFLRRNKADIFKHDTAKGQSAKVVQTRKGWVVSIGTHPTRGLMAVGPNLAFKAVQEGRTMNHDRLAMKALKGHSNGSPTLNTIREDARKGFRAATAVLRGRRLMETYDFGKIAIAAEKVPSGYAVAKVTKPLYLDLKDHTRVTIPAGETVMIQKTTSHNGYIYIGGSFLSGNTEVPVSEDGLRRAVNGGYLKYAWAQQGNKRVADPFTEAAEGEDPAPVEGDSLEPGVPDSRQYKLLCPADEVAEHALLTVQGERSINMPDFLRAYGFQVVPGSQGNSPAAWLVRISANADLGRLSADLGANMVLRDPEGAINDDENETDA